MSVPISSRRALLGCLGFTSLGCVARSVAPAASSVAENGAAASGTVNNSAAASGAANNGAAASGTVNNGAAASGAANNGAAASGAANNGAAASGAANTNNGAALAERRLAELERLSGGRLGVFAVDTGSGRQIRFRADERFPMCSTFKLALAAAVLGRVDAGVESLARRVSYDAAAVLEYAPVAAEHVADGLTIEELCAASVTVSDNTTANLLLDTLGGPAGLTAFFRSVGDSISRLDRNEPLLNTAIAGDARDTTTPRAMAALTRELLLGEVLSAPSRQRLIGWLLATQTGLGRLRKGLPLDYRAGDKTGTGGNGATNDVCIAWPPANPPLLIAAYSVGSSASLEQRSEVLAEVARIVSS